MFPLDQQASVLSLQVQVGDKIIEAKIEKKEEAKEKYDDAMAAGKLAVMAEKAEDIPDMLKFNVGNLLPDQSAIITLKYAVVLKVEN